MRATLLACLLLAASLAGLAPQAGALPCSSTSLPPVERLAANDPGTLPAEITWDGSPRGCVSKVTVERATGTGGFELVATLPPGHESYTDATVSDCTAYTYRVVQHNLAGAGGEATADGSRHHGVPATPTDFTLTLRYDAPNPFLYTFMTWTTPEEPCPVTASLMRTDPGSVAIPSWGYGSHGSATEWAPPGCTMLTYSLTTTNVAGASPAATASGMATNKPASLRSDQLRVRATGPTTAVAEWDDPQADCGLDGFALRAGSATVSLAATLDAGARSFAFEGLVPCQTFDLSLTPFNAYPSWLGSASARYVHEPLGPCAATISAAPAMA